MSKITAAGVAIGRAMLAAPRTTVAGVSGGIVITERGIRLLHCLAAATLGLVVLTVASLLSGPSGPDDRWLGLRAAAALAAAPCPSPTSIAVPTVSPAGSPPHASALPGLRPEADRAGGVDRLAHRPARGRALPPEPAQAALPRPAAGHLRLRRQRRGPRDRDRGRSRLGPQQPAQGPRPTAEAWTDKVIGDRAPFLAYVARAAACATCSPRLSDASCSTRSSARPGSGGGAQLHARQPRPLRRPRARPADQLPAVPRAVAEMAGAGP